MLNKQIEIQCRLLSILFRQIICIAWALSLRLSSVFIVTNLSTNDFNIKINANITYSGFVLSALSFCSATMFPNPVKNLIFQNTAKQKGTYFNRDGGQCYKTIIHWIKITPLFKFRKCGCTTCYSKRAQRCYNAN